jgi:hypothetical protein
MTPPRLTADERGQLTDLAAQVNELMLQVWPTREVELWNLDRVARLTGQLRDRVTASLRPFQPRLLSASQRDLIAVRLDALRDAWGRADAVVTLAELELATLNLLWVTRRLRRDQ